ncbi:T9SS type A sorting domain-containing protein [Riemerella anatipestifer]|uniref:T9SS type A sorting domain-containing protein n=1 Tax=Riemerella anatipestifer TaxID=34085 RepID=UPI0021F892E7|nr:T9SS type A sorting domain-containing protein [Riemerella anatipestifer]MCW0509110.1 T9SS type A sorting domain-containing protein [Riemerella anatipestifer]
MKRNLFLLGALSLVSSLKAQFITYVGDKAGVYVKENALVYSGGGVKVVGTGVIDNSGNIMVVGDSNSKFATVTTAGSDKLDGGNFILRMTNKTVGSLRYGQLYINGLSQSNITGIVDKQYLDAKHGTYQQMALPFYQKQLSSLGSELGKAFGQTRWSQNEILVFNNATVVSDFIAITDKTPKNTSYFMVGAKGFDPSISTMTNQVYTVKGVPYANNISETLTGAGAGVNFGTNGSATNKYRERYNTYWQDAFAITDNVTAWTGDFGKNIYQYGNPFLTNLDLGQLVSAIPNIRGVRIEPSGVISTGQGATYSTGYKFVTFTGGIAVGDTPAIIKPMQTFVIKLKDNTSQTLDFDNLRRFAYTQRALGTNYSVTAQAKKGNLGGELTTLSSNKIANNSTVSSSSTVKQLGLIALDADGKELDRTYYVVYNDAQTGQPSSASTQVAASSGNIIGTFEELPTGGVNESLTNTYWLYINEANEVAFKGKEIPMYTFSDKVYSLKVDIKENAKSIDDGVSKLTSNESFYIKVGDNLTELKQGATLPVTPTAGAAYFGLYYGKPANEVLSSVEVQKPSSTAVVFDSGSSTHKILFDQTWIKADVVVYDMSGRIIISQRGVDASNAFEIKLPAGQGAYLVTAVSEKGVKFSQKIVK